MGHFSIEAEQAVLGAILRSPDLIYETVLQPEKFYHAGHRIIFEQMIILRDAEKTIDFVSLAASFGDQMQELGGTSYLLKLSQSVPTVANFTEHERIVHSKYLMRTGMESLGEVYGAGLDNPTEFAAELMGIAEKIGDESRTKEGFVHIRDGLENHFNQLQDKKYSDKPIGISTAGTALDRITGKWQRQTLNIIAARPSVGKTAFMLNNARINASEGLAVAMFSLEQPESQLYDRLVAAECFIEGERIRTGQLKDEEWAKYVTAFSKMVELNLYIDDTPGLSIQEIRAAVRKLKKKHPDLIVFLDYLQLVTGGKKFDNRNMEVGYVSTSLKQMARENDIPVVALAQLSRGVEQRQDKRPMMSDLRESGNIEQDADTITFLYRDDYYDKETEKRNIIECIVAKNRNGGVGTAEMVNMKQYGKFADLDISHHELPDVRNKIRPA
jgi:replicative DNA helicase